MNKLSKCKNCKTEYQRLRPLQSVCGLNCAIKLGVVTKDKVNRQAIAKDKKETKQKLDAMERLPSLVAKAQAAFNAYIRVRDKDKPCISCGKPLQQGGVGGGFDCGHYRSVGAAKHLRFDEDNAHGQCKHCNRHLAGNHVAYRLGLIERIGLAKVELLERDNTIRKYTREGLIELAKQYRQMTKQLCQLS